MSKFYNITGSTGVTVELVKPTRNTTGIKSVLITNIHTSNDATVTLFIQSDSTVSLQTYNIIHNIAVPAKTSLFLDKSSMFRFGSEHGLYITVGSSDTVDVIVNQ